MRIVKSEGCTAWWTRVDNKDTSDLSEAEKWKIVNDLVNKVHVDKLHILIDDLLDYIIPDNQENYDCDQCNDTQYINTYEI